jgi:hypothetical protein
MFFMILKINYDYFPVYYYAIDFIIERLCIFLETATEFCNVISMNLCLRGLKTSSLGTKRYYLCLEYQSNGISK